MMLDVAPMIVAKSDQLNADDMLGGPLSGTITAASKGNADQPLILRLDCWPQPWKPCKTTMRILVYAWGTDASQWVGRAVRLYRDPSVKWAGKEVGGIRIEALSHIDQPITLALAVARGKKVANRIGVIKAALPAITLDDLLTREGIAVSSVDQWLESKGKPPVIEVSTQQRSALAGFLDANPAKLAEVRAFESSGAGYLEES